MPDELTTMRQFAVIAALMLIASGCAEAIAVIGQGSGPVIQGSIIAFIADEESIGTDLNNDRDTIDRVAQFYSIDTGKITNTGQESERIAISGGMLALEQKSRAIILWDIETNNATGTKVRGSQPALRGSRLAFVTLEADVALDLNDDGDTNDEVVRIQDNELLVNTKATGSHPALLDNAVAFATDESEAGRDLNEDGDRDDSIIMLYGNNRLVNTKATGTSPASYRNTLAVVRNNGLWLLKNNAAEKIQLNITGTNPCIGRDRIAYERNGSVYIYDLVNLTEKEIGRGTSPWLDGKRLVFAQDNNIIMLDLDRQESKEPMQQATGLAVQQAETNTTPAVQEGRAAGRSPLPESVTGYDKPEKKHFAYWFLVAVSLAAIAIILLISLPKWLAKKRKSFGF